MNRIMGVDLGTQSIKVLIYCPQQGEILATESCSIELISREDGSREQLANWWIEGFKNCLKGLPKELLSSVSSIGVSGQQHGFVPLSDSGEVLAPVKLWCDTSTVAECAEIMDAVGGEERCVDISGNTIAAGYTASKILWLKKNIASAYEQMSTILLPHDYLNFYLTGNRLMECGDASGTGLLDIRNRVWSEELVNALDPNRDLMSCLPDLIDAGSPVGQIKPEISTSLGLSPNVMVSAGGGDNMMAAIGTGNVVSGQLTASMGTSGTLFAFSDSPIVDSSGELAAFCSSSGGWLPLLCTMNCTVATEQLRNLFALDVDELETLVEHVPPGSEGVLTLPFYNGERTPDFPDGKAVIYGLDMDNTKHGNLLRSAMEAAVFGLKTGLNAFRRNGMAFNEVILTGGGSASSIWCQICSDVLNLPVRVLADSENAGFGAALQALWCEKKVLDPSVTISDVVREHIDFEAARCYMPEPNRVSAYQTIYQNYQQLLHSVAPLFSNKKS